MTSITKLMIRPEILEAHRARWFVWSGGERIPHTASMRGHWPGYDVECSCGWGSHTGGAIKARVEEALFDHRLDVQADVDLKAEARAAGYDPDDQASYREFLRSKIKQIREG